MTGRTPAPEKPSAAATTCSATLAGLDDADRDPIVGSPGPEVTSASGAKSTVKPSPRSSAPLAAYACWVSAGSPAAPALMKVGNRVAAPRSRSTTPPSWSTPRNSGHFRRTWRVSAALTPRTWSAEATLALKAITPPRWRSRTIATGARVPLQSATITWPARSGRRIRPTTFAARSSSARSGPQPSTRPSASDGVGGTVGVLLAAVLRAPCSSSPGASSPLHAAAVATSARVATRAVRREGIRSWWHGPRTPPSPRSPVRRWPARRRSWCRSRDRCARRSRRGGRRASTGSTH